MSGFLDNDRALGHSIEGQKAVYLAGLAVALVGTIARFLSYRGNARLTAHKPWVRRMGDVAVGISFALFTIVIFIHIEVLQVTALSDVSLTLHTQARTLKANLFQAIAAR